MKNVTAQQSSICEWDRVKKKDDSHPLTYYKVYKIKALVSNWNQIPDLIFNIHVALAQSPQML